MGPDQPTNKIENVPNNSPKHSDIRESSPSGFFLQVKSSEHTALMHLALSTARVQPAVRTKQVQVDERLADNRIHNAPIILRRTESVVNIRPRLNVKLSITVQHPTSCSSSFRSPAQQVRILL
jgi:hypothetical protein